MGAPRFLLALLCVTETVVRAFPLPVNSFLSSSNLHIGAVARKTPIPEREIAICGRLRRMRESIRLSRVAVAAQLGIGTPRLSNYEHGAVPLPYLVGSRFCSTFLVSQKWLAEGGEDSEIRNYAPVSSDLETQIPAKLLFSEAYDSFIKPWLARQPSASSAFWKAVEKAAPELAAASISITRVPQVGEIGDSTVVTMLGKVAALALQELPPHLKWPFYHCLVNAMWEFQDSHRDDAINTPKKGLAEFSESVKHVGVRNLLPGLLARLRAATKKRGTKSALAEYLGVPLASISQWLSGEREPGGETTLRLLNWVERQERHSK